jgi:nitroreductase
MEVYEAVRTVLAVREFQDKAVPEDAVRRIIEAAHLTASSRNGQPWHFIVVQERDTIRRLAGIATTGPYTAQAPLAVVVAMEKSKFAEADAGRAIQSMVLAAWEQGIASNWVGFTDWTARSRFWAFPTVWTFSRSSRSVTGANNWPWQEAAQTAR